MSTISTIILFLIPPFAIFFSILAALKCFKLTHNSTKALKAHFETLISLVALCLFGTFAASADTQTTTAAANTASSDSTGLGYIAAALSTGLSAIGSGIAFGGGLPAAIGATAEDPKNFGKSLIFVALGETLALYGLVISFMIISKL